MSVCVRNFKGATEKSQTFSVNGTSRWVMGCKAGALRGQNGVQYVDTATGTKNLSVQWHRR